jgi:ATPase family AAA domain-containing protein 3A/B
MFGGSNRNNDRGQSLSSVMTPDNPPKRGGGASVTGFDPEGLERAAKAARELDASRNASAAIELIKTQEVTKQVCHVEYETEFRIVQRKTRF